MLVRAGFLRSEKQFVPIGNKLYRHVTVGFGPHPSSQRITGEEAVDVFGNHWEAAATCYLLYEPVPRWDLVRGIMARVMRASADFSEDIAGQAIDREWPTRAIQWAPRTEQARQELKQFQQAYRTPPAPGGLCLWRPPLVGVTPPRAAGCRSRRPRCERHAQFRDPPSRPPSPHRFHSRVRPK